MSTVFSTDEPRKIRAERRKQNLTQAELGKLAGCSAQLIAQIEDCRKWQSTHRVAVLTALGILPKQKEKKGSQEKTIDRSEGEESETRIEGDKKGEIDSPFDGRFGRRGGERIRALPDLVDGKLAAALEGCLPSFPFC